MITILLVSGKIPTLGRLKIKVFWYKAYDVINSVWENKKKSALKKIPYISGNGTLTILKNYHSFSKESFSYISRNETLCFSDQARKKHSFIFEK